MGNCKDCKHWDKEPFARSWWNEQGGQDVEDAHPTHRLCHLIQEAPFEREDEIPEMRGFEDSFFITPATFGCVLFEANDDGGVYLSVELPEGSTDVPAHEWRQI